MEIIITIRWSSSSECKQYSVTGIMGEPRFTLILCLIHTYTVANQKTPTTAVNKLSNASTLKGLKTGDYYEPHFALPIICTVSILERTLTNIQRDS